MIISPPNSFPATIAAGGSWLSGYIAYNDLNAVSASAKSTQAGALTLQRYLDSAGNIPIGTAFTATLTAGSLATVSANGDVAAAFFQITITNTGGSVATITDTVIVLQHT